MTYTKSERVREQIAMRRKNVINVCDPINAIKIQQTFSIRFGINDIILIIVIE
jgi:hypothetical protein